MADEVLTDRRDNVLDVTINRPEAKNAVNEAVARGVAAAMDELDADDDLRVGVITGAGGTFCAGMDLKAFLSGEVPVVEGRGLAGLTQRPPRKPLIRGPAGRGDRVLDPGRIGVLRRQAVVHRQHHRVRVDAQPAAGLVVGIEVADHEAAAVEVDDRGKGSCRRGSVEPGGAVAVAARNRQLLD